MGVHFTVVVDHDLRDTRLEAVRACFQPLQACFDEISAYLDAGAARWQDVSKPGSVRSYHFYAPADSSVMIGAAALKFHHCIRFSAFIEDMAIRDLFRRFSLRLALLFGQRQALYAPCEGIGDEIADWLLEDLSLAAILSRPYQRANPAVTIDALAVCSSPEQRYYVDGFEDIVPSRESS